MPFALIAYLVASRQTPSALEAAISLRETTSVARILESISKEAHVELTAGKQKAKEILIVSVEKAPLKEVMEHIAWATFSRWEKAGEGYRLVADITLERRAQRDYVEQATQITKAGIADYRKRVLVDAKTDREVVDAATPKEKNPYTIIQGAPNARVLAQLLEAVNPGDLVNLEAEGEATVYATHPVGTERSLGPKALNYVTEYVKSMGLPGAALPDGRPAHQFLLKGSATFEGGWVDLDLYDPGGISMIGTMTRNYIYFSPPEIYMAAPKEIRDAIPDQMLVPLSPNSQFNVNRPRIAGESDYGVNERDFEKMPEVVNRLRQPEKYDPLSTFATDIWCAVGKQMGRNVVASLDDFLLVPTTDRNPLKLKSVLSWRYPRNKVEMTAGWIGVRPILPNASWGHQVDREALGKYVRTPATKSDVDRWLAAAEFLDHSGVTVINQFVGEYISWAMAGRYHMSFEPESPIWIFKALTQDQRRAWLNGQSLDISTLSNQVKYQIGKWVLREARWSHQDGLLKFEPSRLFPQGFPTGGRIWSELKGEDGIYVRSEKPEQKFETWMSIEGFANYLEYNTTGKYDRPIQNLDHLQIHRGRRQLLTLMGSIDPQLAPARQTLYVLNPSGGTYVPWKQASPDLLEEIRAARTRAGL